MSTFTSLRAGDEVVMAPYYVSLAKLELCFLEIPSLYCIGLELDTKEIWDLESESEVALFLLRRSL